MSHGLKSATTDFFQDLPELKNTYQNNPFFYQTLARVWPQDISKSISAHLEHMGDLASTVMLEFAEEAERVPPTLKKYSPSGKLIDDVILAAGWKKLESIAAQEGVIATAFERKYGSYSRLYQMALLYLYHPSSAFVSCPMAMTDGAARVLEIYGSKSQQQKYIPKLTSRDPMQFWTSGQWMTEKSGGSDVSRTLTLAHKKSDNIYELTGTKWFTSSVASQMALTLAKDENQKLSLFCLETRTPQGNLNGIEILRLKDKLGTRALPTAELKLTQTHAELVGGTGEGVKKIATLLNITRIYNAICAMAHAQRAYDLLASFSTKRLAFGKTISEHPLHQQMLHEVQAELQRYTHFVFWVSYLLGKEETNEASATERLLLRTLTPLVKLSTGRVSMQIVSECLEGFGGYGYIEESGIPRLLRDAQVFSIWEGTTNVLSLDMLRSFNKEQSLPVLLDLFEQWKEIAHKSKNPRSQFWLERHEKCHCFIQSLKEEEYEPQARKLALMLSDLLADCDLFIDLFRKSN